MITRHHRPPRDGFKRTEFVIDGDLVDLVLIERWLRRLRREGEVGRFDQLVAIAAESGPHRTRVLLTLRPAQRSSPRHSNSHGKATGQAPPN